jgi:NADP-reducing hydrogenase subunit HndD
MARALKTQMAQATKKPIELTVDNKQATTPDGATIPNACKAAGAYVPTLCYLKDINEIGTCHICLVEMEGYNQLVAACDNITLRGIAVHTNTAKMREMRKTNLQFMLTHHDTSCTSCLRSGNCTLQTLAQQFGIHTQPYKKELISDRWNQDFPLIREPDKWCSA